MKLGENNATHMSLPPNLRESEDKAYAYAFDRQMKKLLALAEKLNVWSDLDGVNPRYYDYIAANLRTPYYDSKYSDSQKLRLIKRTFETYRFAGTAKAIEQLITAVFSDARFVPWYEYADGPGEPYHFKIVTAGIPSVDGKALLETMLKRVKAARSIIDGIEIVENPVTTEIYTGMGAIAVCECFVPFKEYAREPIRTRYFTVAEMIAIGEAKARYRERGV